MLFKREFLLLKYFPKKSSYEFLNVGVFLKEEQRISFKLLLPEHQQIMGACKMLDGKILSRAIEHFQESMLPHQGVEEISSYLQQLYKNIFDRTPWMPVRDSHCLEEHLDFLYEEYIGFKFKTKPRRVQRNQKEESKLVLTALIEREFKEYLEITKPMAGFHFAIQNKKNNILHHCFIGRLSHKSDVLAAASNSMNPWTDREQFDFLNYHTIENDQEQREDFLQHNGFHIHHLDTEEGIYQYCEELQL